MLPAGLRQSACLVSLFLPALSDVFGRADARSQRGATFTISPFGTRNMKLVGVSLSRVGSVRRPWTSHQHAVPFSQLVMLLPVASCHLARNAVGDTARLFRLLARRLSCRKPHRRKQDASARAAYGFQKLSCLGCKS